MNKTLKRGCLWTAGVLAVLLLMAAGGLYYLFEIMEWPGGMHSSYRAKDYDARLTKVAATALPMIEAIEKYRHDHGGAFPKTDADFAEYVSPSPSVTLKPIISVNGWIYNFFDSEPGYNLWHKLGWDPALIYQFDGSKGSWTFDPGDGSPEKKIILKP